MEKILKKMLITPTTIKQLGILAIEEGLSHKEPENMGVIIDAAIGKAFSEFKRNGVEDKLANYCICGKEIKGVSHDMFCLERISSFRNSQELRSAKTKHPRSNYLFKVSKEGDTPPYFIVIDNDLEGSRSVTNDIDEIHIELNKKFENDDAPIDNIIYRDSMGVWDLWNKSKGFISLSLHGKSNRNMDTAIEYAKYIFRNKKEEAE